MFDQSERATCLCYVMKLQNSGKHYGAKVSVRFHATFNHTFSPCSGGRRSIFASASSRHRTFSFFFFTVRMNLVEEISCFIQMNRNAKSLLFLVNMHEFWFRYVDHMHCNVCWLFNTKFTTLLDEHVNYKINFLHKYIIASFAFALS